MKIFGLIIAILVFIVAVAVLLAGCTPAPVKPTKVNICTQPFLGEDCLDTYQTFSTFKNGLPCNTCQDKKVDTWWDGCAWTGHKGDPNYWCVTDCNVCSAIIPTFTKKQ